MKKQGLSIVSAFLICLLSVSCSNEGSNSGNGGEGESVIVDETPINELAEFRFSYTIANLPPPMKVLDEFANSNLPANVELLNPTSNAKGYVTSSKKALNYGIYGVDLSYAVFNERTPEILKYYPVVRNLAEELDMSETFNKFTSKFEDYSENKDSLKRVIDEMYSATDSYLRSNERLSTASQILAASWLEAQYLTVSALIDADRSDENEIMYQRVWEQRLYLDNISKLLGEFGDDEEMNKIKKDFDELLLIYKEPADKTEINKVYLTKLGTKLTEARTNIIS